MMEDDDGDEQSVKLDDDSSSEHESELRDQVMPLDLRNQMGTTHRRASSYGNGEGFERVSRVPDLETGRKGGYRAHHAVRRSVHSMRPTEAGARRRKRALRGLCGRSKMENSLDTGSVSIHGGLRVQERPATAGIDTLYNTVSPAQYRLTALKARSRLGRFVNFIGSNTDEFGMYDESSTTEANNCLRLPSAETLARRFLFWSFRSHTFLVFLAAVVSYLLLTNLFAIGIYIAWWNHSSCIGGVDSKSYADAWYLSYQTMATTGYGLIYSKSSDEPGRPECVGMTILTSLEGYCGLLFASVYAAIMIVKVGRIQSHAPVEFSGPIAVAYGNDRMHDKQKDSDKDYDSCDSFELANLPCPTLEIRLVNLMSAVFGGELVNCHVNVVAVIDEKQVHESAKDVLKGIRQRPKLNRWSSKASRHLEGANLNGGGNDRSVSAVDRADLFQVLDKSVQRRQENGINLFEEDESGYLLSKRVFAKLEVESPRHPFFNRSWVIRHDLNEYSPLLDNSAREAIRKNNGCWPHELNSHQGVRAAIVFDQILVNFSGTSNAGGNAVYSQKIYDTSDLFIGYNHVSVLYVTTEGNMAVDYDLTHDVVEQRLGDGEPADDDRQAGRADNPIMVL